jgi:hypothetical protein
LERHKKGIERAEVVKGQLEGKLTKSLGRLRTIQERRKDWEVLNGDGLVDNNVGPSGAVKGSKFAALDEVLDSDEEKQDEQEVEETTDESMKIELPMRVVQEHDPALVEQGEGEDVVE